MASFLIIIIFLVTLAAYIYHRNRFPGPFKIPVLGSILVLKRKRGQMDWVLQDSVTSNPVTMIQAVRQDIYLVNDYDLAKDLFSKDLFSHRTLNFFISHERLFQIGIGSGIIFNNGEGWSTQRRFSLRTLRDFGFGKQSMEGAMNLEIDELIERYQSEKGDVLIESDFNLPIINILWQMVANSRINDAKGERMVELVNWLFANPMGHFVYPAAVQKMFPNITGYAPRAAVLEEHKKYLLDIIDQHEKTFDGQHLRDFIDVYLAAQVKSDSQGLYSKFDLASILLDFFHAGTETSSTTLKWFVLFMTIHQDWQAKCRQEINHIVGSSRPELKHMQHLHILMASLLEVQRMSCTAPMSLPHNLSEAYNYGGFKIPKGSMFMVNLSFIMKNPKYFSDPKCFNPARFLDHDGNFVKNEHVIPFGIGKRFCMGELLARNEIFLFAANLLQKLKFDHPENHEVPSSENYTANFTNIPNSYHVRISSI